MAPSGEPKDSPKPQPLGSLPFLWLFTICTLCVFFLLWRRANSLRTVVSHQLKTWTRAEGQIRLSEDDGPPAHTFVEDSDNEDDADDGEPLAMRVERLRQERQRLLAAGVTAPTNNNNKDGSNNGDRNRNSNGNTLTNSSRSLNNNLNPELGSDPLLGSLTSSATPLPVPTSRAPFSNTHTRTKTDMNTNDATSANGITTNSTPSNTNNNTNNSRNSSDSTGLGVSSKLIDTNTNSSVSPQKSGVLTNCVDDPLSS
ncbi:hypothetical protein PNOK_0871800 [Pyrrhoderma noxium]|uniref:Uncharacterized protein n=1 Tax=Pyrrhoderma noxium TaxID=2282107 RepID=A0A286U8G3_9AGAM|nr:hypothetical protein PNOK_0871800 [Pyrrhoderma noxium]